MAKSITIGSFGTAGRAPTTANIKWNQAVVKDEVLLELFEGLTIGELEILSSVPQIDTSLEPISVEGFNNVFVKLIINNTSIKTAIAAKKFTITIRHIDTAVVYGTINYTYDTVYTKVGIISSTIRQWATNNNYGNGTTQFKAGDIIQFARYPYTYNSLEAVETVKDSAIKALDPRSTFTPLKPTVLTVTYGSKAVTAVEGANTVAKHKDTWKTITAGLTPLWRQPIIKGKSSAKGGANTTLFAVVQNMDTTTRNTADINTLLWGSTFTITLDKSYYGFKTASTIHPECARGVNILSVKWDNQQSDIVKAYPYFYKGQFHCKLQALKNVARAALIGIQLHHSCAWDNGNYPSKVVRFDLKAGTNKTPIDLLEREITVKVGEAESYTIFTPSGTYRYTIDKPTLCEVDQNNSRVIGLSPGTAYVTFTSKYSNLANGSIKLKVNVVDVPSKPSLTVNRRIVIVAVGDSAGVTVRAVRADKLNITQNPTGHVRIYDYTTEDFLRTEVSGKVNFRGLKEGVTNVTITSMFKDAVQLTEVIEVHVIKRGTYMIMADPLKIKLDIKKNRYPDKKPAELWATTNAKYIKITYPVQESFFHEGEPVYTELNTKIWPKTERGKYVITLYGHMLDPNKRVVSLDIPIQVTKNVEVPKDQVWVSVEHKQIGHNDNEDLDFRYFSVLKWLNRKHINQVTGHTIKLPTRSGTLLTQEELEATAKNPKKYHEYFKDSNPTRNVNPTKLYSMWLNTTDGKMWVCMDNTKDDNAWICEDGRQIGSVERLRFPVPGERGFGVGPMSIDLHEEYGITPLEGCYDPQHPNYGNYMDANGNILVCIPRHYIKYDPSENK